MNWDAKNLIGKPYPVKDTDGNIIGFKPIVSAKEMQDFAAYGITLSEDGSIIVLSFFDAMPFFQGDKSE